MAIEIPMFQDIFNVPPMVVASANGRVNLIGEHTDYNHGLVMPIQIEQTTTVSLAKIDTAPHGTIQMFSTTQAEDTLAVRIISDTKQHHWTDYIIASLREAQNMLKNPLPGLQIHIHSTIPSGAGVSSSAALEIAVIRAIKQLFACDWDALTIAHMAQDAENNYVAMPCGCMDQMIISMGQANYAMKIDFSNLAHPLYHHIPLFSHASCMVFSSGIAHRLDSQNNDGYKTRRTQCETAAAMLSVPHLSVLSTEDLPNIHAKLQDTTLIKRVTHVVVENKRVQQCYQALQNNNAAQFGDIMLQSHESQRALYEVSLPEIDLLVQSAIDAGAYGARLTGGGFGGSIVALVPTEKKTEIQVCIHHLYPQASLLAVI